MFEWYEVIGFTACIAGAVAIGYFLRRETKDVIVYSIDDLLDQIKERGMEDGFARIATHFGLSADGTAYEWSLVVTVSTVKDDKNVVLHFLATKLYGLPENENSSPKMIQVGGKDTEKQEAITMIKAWKLRKLLQRKFRNKLEISCDYFDDPEEFKSEKQLNDIVRNFGIDPASIDLNQPRMAV